MGTNRNERTVKEPATFKTEGCFGALGGGGGACSNRYAASEDRDCGVLHLPLALVEGGESRPSFSCDQ